MWGRLSLVARTSGSLLPRQVYGPAMHEDAQPRATRGALRIEPTRGAPQIEKTLLNRVLSKSRVPQYAECDAVSQRSMQPVQTLEGSSVSRRDPREKGAVFVDCLGSHTM